jgi:hypothetical protein
VLPYENCAKSSRF